MFSGGKIPDAALIHAARKRRQQFREMGGANYIPVNEETSNKPEYVVFFKVIILDTAGSSDSDCLSCDFYNLVICQSLQSLQLPVFKFLPDISAKTYTRRRCYQHITKVIMED